MKILFLSHRIPWPLRDGGAIAIYNNLKGFKEAGHEVKLLCLNPIKDKVEPTALPDLFHAAGLRYQNIDTAVKPIGALLNLFSSESYNSVRFKNADFARLVQKTILDFKPDLVHVEGAFAAQYIDAIKEIASIPCVLREHNVEFKIWEGMSEGEKNPMKRAYLKLLSSRLEKYEKALWHKFDLISAITSEDAEYIQKYVPAEKVINGGVGFDLSSYISNTTQGSIHSLYHLASMDWLPNKEAVSWALEEIWPKLEAKFPKAELFLAGKKMPQEFISQSAGRLHVEAEVDDAIDFMQDKGVMIVPLLSGSGIRIKIIEAMAMGSCVISTTRGLIGLGAEPGVHVLEANTADEFVLAYERLLSEEGFALKMANAAREFAREHFELTTHIARSTEAYLSLMPTI